MSTQIERNAVSALLCGSTVECLEEMRANTQKTIPYFHWLDLTALGAPARALCAPIGNGQAALLYWHGNILRGYPQLQVRHRRERAPTGAFPDRCTVGTGVPPAIIDSEIRNARHWTRIHSEYPAPVCSK